MRYLLITEDITFLQTDTLTDAEYESCDNGFLFIVDTENMTEYYNGKWHEVKKWEYSRVERHNTFNVDICGFDSPCSHHKITQWLIYFEDN